MDSKSLIKKILLCFEQSSTTIKYKEVYEYEDGPNDKKQITVSFGITEYGNLKELIKSYCFKNGRYTEKFTPYLPLIGKVALVDNNEFVSLLKESGDDVVMQLTQEQAFDNKYIIPAFQWCEKNKLELPLSKLVIADSFLHSGSILTSIRNMFPATIDNEKLWIEQYCNARKSWLANHSRKVLHNTVYRMNFMLDLIEKNDWELNKFPYKANGVRITE